uniref:Furin, paired basic amino acid cleaving enzyme n=1 Tax=Eptatretus burgeri TaxID=7764 RepID=A0A8C4Q905_EPTBU
MIWRSGLFLLLYVLFRLPGSILGFRVFTNTWAARVVGGSPEAERLAHKHGFTYLGQILQDHYHFQHRALAKRSLSCHHSAHVKLQREPTVRWLEQQVARPRRKRDLFTIPTDPKYPVQWYLHNKHGQDLNVEAAWRQGITGRGIVITILDDGIEKNHPDLANNYDSGASFDVNGNDPDPQPRYTPLNENRHGTRCAGEVAAIANDICGVGVAYNARIGGVRMLDGDVTDAVEARSISLNPQHISVYSASWGPEDDGRTVDGPAYLAKQAFEDGIRRGRDGLGSIFVWASGNGGRDRDNCNCDGYTNSIYTLSISSSTQNGNVPWYSEACSSTLATTYSSGANGEQQIVTTDLRMRCTDYHTGTSASAPLAAGIIALVLEANPNLTWRDMQHLVVQTSNPTYLHARDWQLNGANRRVSHSFGYGMLDAGALVDKAKTWNTVHPQRICSIVIDDVKHPISQHLSLSRHLDACFGTDNRVSHLEHVEAKLSLSFSRRGNLAIYLTSPAGTKSTLLAPRPKDYSTEGFTNWSFMTTHNWDENPVGTWILTIDNMGPSWNTGELKDLKLIFYGTCPSCSPELGVPTVPTSVACVETNSAGLCVACKPPVLLFHNACVERCPDGYYHKLVDSTTKGTKLNLTTQPRLACQPCHVACASCWGPSDTNCYRCAPHAHLNMLGSVCVRQSQVSRATASQAELQALLGRQEFSVKQLVTLGCIAILLVFLGVFGTLQWYTRRARRKRGVVFGLHKDGLNSLTYKWLERRPCHSWAGVEEEDGEEGDRESGAECDSETGTRC